MKINTQNLKRKAKGAIAIGAVSYSMDKLVEKVVVNPAIPLIPKIGIEVAYVAGASLALMYGMDWLVNPEPEDTIQIGGESKELIKKHVSYEVVDEEEVNEEEDA